MLKPESHYQKEDGRYLIEIRLNDIRQLFNSFDPAPFLEKDLDSGAEKYIVDSVQELHLDTPIALILHLPDVACTDEAASSVPAAIHHYFSYRAEITCPDNRTGIPYPVYHCPATGCRNGQNRFAVVDHRRRFSDQWLGCHVATRPGLFV
jgi:hypothetical protein